MAKLEAEGSLALAPQGSWRPSLNLMAGGIKTFGRIPFFETARLGGMRTLRGYRPDRFAGEAAVYGSAELRVPISKLQIVIPGEQGIFGFGDAGRVYVQTNQVAGGGAGQSDQFHTSVGGGIWMSFLSRDNVLFVGMGRPTKDKEGTRVIAGFGFPF
jgi:hemolysin activation/secretion protein